MYFVNDWCMRNICLSESELSRLVVFHPSQAFHFSIFISEMTGTLGTPALQSSERHQGAESFAQVKWAPSWWRDLLSGFLPFCEIYYLLNDTWALLYTNLSCQKISFFWNKVMLKETLIYLDSQWVVWRGDFKDRGTAGNWRHIGK